VGGDERDKLRDVERLIRRTLPVEGTLSNEMPAPRQVRGGQRPSRPNGSRPAAGHHRPSNPRGNDTAPVGKPAPKRGGQGRPAAAGASKPAPAGKPRWNSKRKTAAKATTQRPVRFGG
jgi:ATP-dependent RNA helicase RhlE